MISILAQLLPTPETLALPFVKMADHVDAFTHDIAIQLSRTLNLTNPNDLLAKRVIQIARNDRNPQSFTKGRYTAAQLAAIPTHTCSLACASFGRFKPEFLLELYAKIDSHLRDSANMAIDQRDTSAPVTASTASDETVVMSNNLPGGLLRPNKSSNSDEVRLLPPIFILLRTY